VDILALRWTEQENVIFIGILEDYRKSSKGKTDKEIRNITRSYAQRIFDNHTIIQKRSIQAIYEHLTYFDDLMAGIKSKDYYARKDEPYFNLKPRQDGNMISNPARVIRDKK
jgi:hypothetical protein